MAAKDSILIGAPRQTDAAIKLTIPTSRRWDKVRGAQDDRSSRYPQHDGARKRLWINSSLWLGVSAIKVEGRRGLPEGTLDPFAATRNGTVWASRFVALWVLDLPTTQWPIHPFPD